MGQSMNMLATHSEVPDEVKATVLPVDYEPAPAESRPTDHLECEDCGEAFGWFCYSTNCDWCGRQLCTRCCPSRHLLKGKPGCHLCTKKAYNIRRAEMLEEHYIAVGVEPPLRANKHATCSQENAKLLELSSSVNEGNTSTNSKQ